MRPGCALGATPRQLDHTRDASATCRRPSACNVRGMSANSFDARATLRVGDRELEIFRLDALQSEYDVARLPFSLKVLLENLLRTEGNGSVTRGHRGAGDLGRERRSRARRSPSRPRAWSCRTSPACPRSSTSPRCATRWPTSAATRRSINPLVPAELVIDHSVQVDAFGTRDAFAHQRRARVRAQPRALRVPALGPGRVRQLQGRAARAPGIVHQVNLEYLARVVFVDDAGRHRLPRHARRHRLAHDDDQRPRRARLGRRRHRGRGGDARPADVDAHPAGHRLQAARRAARGRDRDRPRPHRHRAAAQEGRRRQVRRVLRPRRLAPAARRPRDDRQHEPRVRLDLRDLPDRRRDAALPGVLRAARRSRSSSSRPTPRSRASGTTRTPRSRRTPTRSSSTSATSCPRSPARSARRTASR